MAQKHNAFSHLKTSTIAVALITGMLSASPTFAQTAVERARGIGQQQSTPQNPELQARIAK